MTNKITLPPTELEALITNAFIKEGVSEKNAKSVAKHLVIAEGDGQIGHGVSRVRSYIAQVRTGQVNGKITPQVHPISPSLYYVDAGFGFAFPAIDEAIHAGLKAVETQGSIILNIGASHHAGVMGVHVERIAKAGMIGLMVANAPSAIAPWGGNKPLYGTNPIAFACPRLGDDPIVIDMSLSKVARGKVMRARTEGKEIPEGWAIDVDGNPTTDPEAAIRGSMLPMGDVKGAALAMMIELLTAGLADSHFGFEASSLLEAGERPSNIAHTIFIIKPYRENFLSRVESLMGAILSQEGTRIPGANRSQKRMAVSDEGISILKSDYEFMQSIVNS